MSLFPARESLVSDILAGDGKIINLFYSVYTSFRHSKLGLYNRLTSPPLCKFSFCFFRTCWASRIKYFGFLNQLKMVCYRECWNIYRGPGFLAVVWFGSSPTLSPLSRRQVDGGKGEGVRGGDKSWDHKKASSCIIHLIPTSLVCNMTIINSERWFEADLERRGSSQLPPQDHGAHAGEEDQAHVVQQIWREILNFSKRRHFYGSRTGEEDQINVCCKYGGKFWNFLKRRHFKV